ncbi:MAG TPA: agmatine deiminase family protein, partial [Myxococcota bacterium]|nr:agmatine deiminase family protein [Myxococcota bacterium]
MLTRPPEWQKNKEIWLAWPFDQELWQENLPLAQREFLALVEAFEPERLVLLFPNEEELSSHKNRFSPKNLSFRIMRYADIWIRDTFPIAVLESGLKKLVLPVFNGWGRKYLFKDDQDLSARTQASFNWPAIKTKLIFEGGAIECDGAGTLLTTEQCLLNNNRNPQWNKPAVEDELKRLFGAHKVIWL